VSSRHRAADLSKVRTVPLRSRPNLVGIKDFAKAVEKGSSFGAFMDSFCAIEHRVDAASNLRNLVASIGKAKRKRKPIVWGLGPHLIKYGLSPLIIHLMKKGYVSAIAMNGACAIHDAEIALIGETSEEMAGEIETGRFGMAAETGEFINAAARTAYEQGLGFGESLGGKLRAAKAPFRKHSLLASAHALSLPATVHVAIGTDIVHMHPTMDGAATGAASFRDFRILTEVMKGLGHGGVYINIASTVILPEVFLKTLTAANNLLRRPIRDFTTANFNHLSEYRPLMNVVRRPMEGVGRGYEIIGRIEIMIPLLVRAILEQG